MSMQNHLIARRHLFSTAHFYAQKRFSEAENRANFGACFTPHGHGHNYVIEAFVSGGLDPQTGLVMNVTDLDIHMKKVCAPFDHHHVNFDVPEFADAIPTTENLASYLFNELKQELSKHSPELKLHHIRLYETDDLWAEASDKATKPTKGASVTRQVEIRSIHHLENKAFSEKRNKAIYGICYGTHGHHYKVQVTCVGQIDEKTGLAVQRDELDAVLKKKIVDPYDGVDLNKKFPNTSCEALAKEFFELLRPELGNRLIKIGIQETRKNYFEFPAAGE
ncbi:MAG TPA: 6-carboxytetrahydropterin synthase [Bdellovibrionales bacterium]|nr:6-carboxytetrahydropterin synthase [Bdellovibrionales bacterium]